MSEQELTITENGNYKNLHLKSNLGKGQKGLDDGNHVIILKANFAEGYENKKNEGTDKAYSFFNCRVEYKGEEASFLLYDKEHEAFKNCGGVGDQVKITLNKVAKINPVTNVEMLLQELSFELVE